MWQTLTNHTKSYRIETYMMFYEKKHIHAYWKLANSVQLIYWYILLISMVIRMVIYWPINTYIYLHWTQQAPAELKDLVTLASLCGGRTSGYFSKNSDAAWSRIRDGILPKAGRGHHWEIRQTRPNQNHAVMGPGSTLHLTEWKGKCYTLILYHKNHPPKKIYIYILEAKGGGES